MFDLLTMAAVADEIGRRLLDGRIQRIGLVDRRTIAAEVYAGGQRHALVASADDREARLLIVSTMPSLDADLVTPFSLLLRKYLRGGIIVGVNQPPLERLVRLSIAKRLVPNHRPAASDDESASEIEFETDDDGEEGATYVHLAVEIMGRHSNLILIDDDGRVMESAKRVTPAMSRVRPVLPRLRYIPPPPLDKPDPRRLTAAEASALLADERPEAGLAPALVRLLRGISPQMAREIAYRATGDVAATIGTLHAEAPTAVARETRALLEPLLTSAWSARVYRESGATSSDAPADAAEIEDPARRMGDIVAFSAIPLAHLATSHVEEVVAGISAAAELAGGQGETGPVRHAQRRDRLLASIRSTREKQERRLWAVREQASKATETEQLREWGEAIYAYLWQIQPGQQELLIDDRRVPLDPTLSAKDNAQAYFERYRKAQGAGVHGLALEAEIGAELAYLDQLRTLSEQTTEFAGIEALAAEWEAHTGTPSPRGKPRRRPEAKRPRPLLDDDGNAVYIGRSGPQNDQITFDLAGPNDTWLHARGVPGSHVVVRWRHPNGEEELETIEAAASLAAFYSAARGGSAVEVDITRRRHVRKIKGTGPGMVTYRQERTIAVRPADEAGVIGVLAGNQAKPR